MKILGYTITREATAQETDTTPKAGGANWIDDILKTDDKQAMQIAAVYRCINLRSDSVAIMPLQIKRRANENEAFINYDRNDREHWNYLFNVKPNERMNGFVFKKNLVMHMDMKGNAFIMCKNSNGKVVKPNSGEVASIYLLPDAPAYDVNKNKYMVTDQIDGIRGTYSAEYVIHIKAPGSDGGFWGESILEKARRTTNLAADSEASALKNIKTGGLGKFILGYTDGSKQWGTHNQKQLNAAADEVAKTISEKSVTVLPDPTLHLERLNLSAQDMQFLQLREFSIKDISRWFGVPIYKLGESTSNYKSVDAAQVDFYVESLQPICSQIETELHSKVTTLTDYDKYKFDFDEAPLFALDRASQSAWMKTQIELGLKSVNDLRKEMDIAPAPDGNTVLMSANLKSISTLKNEGE